MHGEQANGNPSESADPDEQLKGIATRLRKGEKVDPVTVRELLSWFGAQRRGWVICFAIDGALEEAGLVTNPRFLHQYIDGPIEFSLAGEKPNEAGAGQEDENKPTETGGASVGAMIDPTYRIGRLRSANITPTSVSPNQSISECITIMLANDFSQLPVMVGEREVKGVIGWGTIGRNLALGVRCSEARECMDAPRIIKSDMSLFGAITEIVQNQYVLVQDSTNKICGIVTTSDLSLQFQQLTEPFLLLGEIENHVRGLIHQGGFTTEQLRNSCEAADGERVVNGVFDMNFGEYISLLEDKSCWDQLKLAIDRKVFIGSLDKVRRIRNDVMHFDPDGITDDDLKLLRNLVGFLQKLQSIFSAAKR